jgi:group I intron endonuclease
MNTDRCGIYKITNTISGNYYIGSASSIYHRIAQHRSTLKSNTHKNRHLQRAYNKYGEQVFEYSVVIFCDIEHRLYYEQTLLDGLKPYYNIAPNATGTLGVKRTAEQLSKQSARMVGKKIALGTHWNEESRRRVSEARKGTQPEGLKRSNYNRAISEETRQKMRDAQKNRPPMSEETRRKISEGNKGKHVSDEARSKIALARTGTHASEATKQKMKDSAKRGDQHRLFGKHLDDETKRKLSEANKGKRHTEETKRKMSEAQKSRPPKSEETRRKLSEANKGKIVSEETKRKLSERLSGKRNVNFGKKFSEERKAKISESQKIRWERIRSQAYN